MKSPFVICGASGNVGSRIAEWLLAARRPVGGRARRAPRGPGAVPWARPGARLSEGTVPILGLHDLESKLETLMEAGVVHLRPAYFMENHLWSIPVIRTQGVNGSPVRPDVPIPMVATQDIADAEVPLSHEGSFTGRSVRYLLGPRGPTA